MSEDLGGLSYERALAELDTVISKLEKGDVDLDEAIACYERGSRLAQHCAALLDRTEQKVTQLVVGGSGRVIEKPIDGASPPPDVPPQPARARAVQPERQRPLPIDPDDIPF
ncbi:MAG: exodeoxyribonuclease VII small subunit [Candidatus Dormibacteria bacterium]